MKRTSRSTLRSRISIARGPGSSRRTRGWLALILVPGLVLAGCGRRESANPRGAEREEVAPPPIPASLQAELETWLSRHGKPPADYVLGLFATRDVVILGEQHRIRHDVLLVHSLLPRLHAAGVRTLALEYARREDQGLIDSIVNAPQWREDLGREVFFRGFMPWGYREYVDLLKIAWQVNRTRSADTPPFRILGVNNSLDFGLYKSEADWDDPEIRKQVARNRTEADWATPVLEAVAKGEKVLAYCGIHHAFTGFRQPRVENGRFMEFGQVRFGNHLRAALGTRAVTVFLHAPWNGSGGYDRRYVHPAEGRIDAFMLGREGGPFPVGFDIAGCPLAELPIADAVYKHGYDTFTMATFCDGWIYTKPVGAYEPVAYIEDWVNDENLVRARATAMNPRWRDDSVEELNAGCRSYLDDFRIFFGHLR